jgi:transcriptional regulator with XRE-family HTH domain
MTAGQNIKAAREKAGISQTELAERIGTTRQQIGKYEQDKQDMTVARMLRIAAALGIDPSTLVKPE